MQYSKMVKKRISKTISSDKTGGHWKKNDSGYEHICLKLEDNFIDALIPENCSIKGTWPNCKIDTHKIKYHIYSKHLNSSQIMCIAFFKKFFEEETYEQILLNSLKDSGLKIEEGLYITNAIFEYEPDSKEKTNFDFYLILSTGQHISFEIKYTESDFGGISICKNEPDKYKTKWENSYSKLVKKCPYFSDTEDCKNDFLCVNCGKINSSICEKSETCSIFNFYKHYQINRNIAFAENNNDIVAFLTPKANDQLDVGRDYIDSFKQCNIINIYWEELLEKILNATSGIQELNLYYKKFADKYIG